MTSVSRIKQICLKSNIFILLFVSNRDLLKHRGVETLTASTFYRDQVTISCPRLHKHQFLIHYNLPEISLLSDDGLKSASRHYEQNKNQCFKQNWSVFSTNNQCSDFSIPTRKPVHSLTSS